jgi:probable F420-dependent oxidoreductase
MKIGLVLPMDEPAGGGESAWPRIRGLSTHAESAGLDSLWVYDHFLFRFPDQPEEGIHEAWTLLTAVAAVTERVELGTIVLGTAFRPPALTAKMAATLDEVSNGRLILGLGTGWHEPEYTAFGYPFDHRAGRFAETLEIIVPLVRGERVTFHGRWHDVEDAVLIPPPPRPTRLPGQMPILVAAKGERVLGLVARWADAWNMAWFGVPNERATQRLADLRAACETAGRDPSTVEVTVGVQLAGPDATAAEDGSEALPRDADAVARAFDAWRDLGVGHVQMSVDAVDEAALDVLSRARTLHLGGG